MAIQFSNLASTTLASGVSSSATSVSVTSASLFPSLGGSDYFYATLGDDAGSEIVKVTAISGTTFTVVRGQDGTSAISHSAGTHFALRVTAAALEDLRDSPNVESVSKSGDTMTGNLSLGDNVKLQLGNQTDGDLQIYHNGGNSIIRDVGTGDLRVQGANLQLLSSNGKKYLYGVQDAYTKLYYDNAEKLATTSTGIDVTGNIESDSVTIGVGSVATTEKLRVNGTVLTLGGSVSTPAIGIGDVNTGVYAPTAGTLGWTVNGTQRLLLNSTGADITGVLTADGLTLGNANYISMQDTGSATPRMFGINSANTTYLGPIDAYAGGDVLYGVSANLNAHRFYTGANTRLNIASNGDISFYNDSAAQAFYWDSSTSRLGLGVTNPAVPLHVSGTARADIVSVQSELFLGSSSMGKLSQSGSNWVFNTYASGAFGERFRIKDTGVDVSGSVTSTGLTVNTTSDSDSITTITSSATSNNTQLRLGTSGNDSVISGSGGSNGGLKFKVYGSEKMAISSAGNVNIPNGGLMVGATTAPTDKLEIRGNAKIEQTSNVDAILRLNPNSGTIGSNYRWELVGRNSAENYNFQIRQGATPYLTINNSIGGNAGAATFSGEVSAPALDLQAIAQSKSDTAVDVFVYDTSKDSDGGAWRHRTQGTSWYNETLNTSTRGATKKFPSVAVIVVASNDVIIYDGDDPDMPLWMEFSLPQHSPSSNWGSTSIGLGSADFQAANPSTAIMLNAQLVIGCASGTGLGGYLVNFISELMIDMVQYGTATDQFYHKVGNISQRDVTTLVTVPVRYSYSQVSPKISGRLINGAVNDVAMTVLPNAPIDPDTGLPVPTIAVATNGGISIIKDTGTVVDIISNSGSVYTPTSFVDIDDNYNLIFEQDSGGRSLMFIPIPSADRTTVANDGDRTDKRMLPTSSTGTGLNLIPRFNGSNASIAVSGKGDDQYIYGGEGVTSYAFGGTKLQSSVAYITSDYNTGHMVGDIKLATLSDTDATNVTGSELVTNGTFASNTTGWTAVNSSTLSYSSGKLRITNGASLNGAANTTITTVVGKTYVVSGEYTAGTSATGQLRVGTTTMGAQLAAGPFAAGIQTRTFVATGTTTHINFINSSVNGQYGEIDNISVRLAEEDRSVNGNGLQVFGTVTKTAVATGADLVSYGGFSRSNYLEQPYNSDLDFGTGDFSIMGWLQASSSNAGFRQTILDRGSASLDSIAITREYNGKFVCTAGSTVLTSTGTAYTSGNIHFALVRKSGTLAIYANGILDSAVSSTTNVTDTDAVMIIGVDRGLSASNWFTRDKLALLRISATAPTAEQIAKIYNDEKPLFQENAQATLYGTSNAVTALAYDDDTELLHVGTSAGRSVFQGLRRVDNTTDAVGAAISASNGLVAED